MAQKRYWNFKDPDNVRDINRWLLGILPKGLYYGFDTIDLDSTLVLKIRHTNTGQIESKNDNTASNLIGKFITPQGIVVTEDAVVTVSGVSANSSGNPRIDIVVATSIFVETVGGANVTYSIIQGTPGSNPVAPSLANELTQTIIGYLYVPNGTTALNSGGVLWTRPPYRQIGNRPDNFSYMDREQLFTSIQKFSEIRFGGWQTATQEDSVVTLPSGNNKSNICVLNATGQIDRIVSKETGSLVKILNIGAPVQIVSGENILVPNNIFLFGNGNVAEFVYNVGLSLWIMTGYPASEFARINAKNRFKAIQCFNEGGVSYTSSGQKLNLFQSGNTFKLTGITVQEISQLTELENGTEITIVNNLSNDVLLKHNASPNTSFLGMFLPLGKDIILRSGDNIILKQTSGMYYQTGGQMKLQRNYIRRTINATQ
jgi:hypothetical protein